MRIFIAGASGAVGKPLVRVVGCADDDKTTCASIPSLGSPGQVVLAPDDGLIGVTEVFPGTLVGKGNTTLLTKMSKIDPIKVRFSVSERDYLFYAKRREARLAAAGAGLILRLRKRS